METPAPSFDYNEEPVHYCSRCYSLKIQYEEVIDSECCMDCGCSDVVTAPIEEWEKLYERRYGHKYTTKTLDVKKTYMYQLPLPELKSKLYASSHWSDIIHAIYPTFPGGLGCADSLILFFDKLVSDGRLDSLRMLLCKHPEYIQ